LTIHELATRFLGGLAGKRPTDAVRRSVLRAVLAEAPALEYFAAVKDLKGFQALLAESIKEFKANLLSIGRFEKIAQPLLSDAAFGKNSGIFPSFSSFMKNPLRPWVSGNRRTIFAFSPSRA